MTVEFFKAQELTSYIVAVKREGQEISFLYKTASYRTALFWGNTTPAEPSAAFVFQSTILSLKTNFESERYPYSMCPVRTTQHPLCRFQSSARGPRLLGYEVLNGLNGLTRASLVEHQNAFIEAFIERSDKPN